MKLHYFFVTALTVAACGPAAIGEECEDVGHAQECEDDALCTNEADGTATCRALCFDDTACGADHKCNGVSGTNFKTCQPK